MQYNSSLSHHTTFFHNKKKKMDDNPPLMDFDDNDDSVFGRANVVPYNIDIPLEPSTPKKGRTVHPVWLDFTTSPDPHKVSNGNSSVCKHCSVVVLHHNKNSYVQRHLLKCRFFLKVMRETPQVHMPEWFL